MGIQEEYVTSRGPRWILIGFLNFIYKLGVFRRYAPGSYVLLSNKLLRIWLSHLVLVSDSNIFVSFEVVHGKDEYCSLLEIGVKVILRSVGAWVESYCFIRTWVQRILHGYRKRRVNKYNILLINCSFV